MVRVDETVPRLLAKQAERTRNSTPTFAAFAAVPSPGAVAVSALLHGRIAFDAPPPEPPPTPPPDLLPKPPPEPPHKPPPPDRAQAKKAGRFVGIFRALLSEEAEDTSPPPPSVVALPPPLILRPPPAEVPQTDIVTAVAPVAPVAPVRAAFWVRRAPSVAVAWPSLLSGYAPASAMRALLPAPYGCSETRQRRVHDPPASNQLLVCALDFKNVQSWFTLRENR